MAMVLETVRQTVRLHRVQQAFRQSDALYRGFVGGRGVGKTWIGAYDLIRRARRGRTYLVGSPTGVLLGDTTFPTFKARAEELGVWDPSSLRMVPYPTVTLTTGAVVRFRTAEDPERMRGPNLSGVWLDEASLMKHEAYLISIAALREAGEQGWLSATFTPKGKAHWTYKLFGTLQPNTAIFHAATRENPFNPAGFAEGLTRSYGGADSALTRQELSGRFLDDEDIAQVIPSAWVEAAQGRWTPEPPFGVRLDALGVDVARGGRCKTVICRRFGVWFGLRGWDGSRTPDGLAVVPLVASQMADNCLINIDAFGVGADAYGKCCQLLPGARIVAVMSGDSVAATDTAGVLRFADLRSYLWWSLRELLDPNRGMKPALPPSQELLADLTAPTWRMTPRGVKVEAKEDIIKRLGRSTDWGDSVVYSLLLPMPS